LEKQNVIVVGLPAENPILAEVADTLPFPLGALSSSGAIQGAKPVGAVEQIASPWNARYRLLVISGANDELVGRAAYLLADTRQRPRLRGEVALVDADGVVTTIASQARPTPVPGRAIGTRATPSWVTIVALGALAVLVVLIGIAVVRRLAQRGAGRKGPAA
ncbi:MAG: cellulose biosynthesis cyclic di-GMP-binding regulatory protein BcsB, partial [Chloroflexi bacterium]|nr:cellulose biosynthesis cyclic di-GMP-binding regulatory protein BcsB [Chloroflexota bacterium]